MIKKILSDSELKNPARFLVFPLWLITIYVMGVLMAEAATICLWIVCGFFLFVLLDPASEFLKKHRWPTALAGVTLVLLATVLTGGLIYLLGYLTTGMVVELEQSKALFLSTFKSLNASWNHWTASLPALHAAPAANSDVSKVEVVQGSPFGEFGGTIMHSLGSAVTVMTFALLVPILSFFFIAERDAFARVFVRAYNDESVPGKIWHAICDSVRAFFVGNLVLAIVTYPVFLLLFWFFSVPSIWTVAALATFFNLIPFVGAVLSGFLPAVALYTVSQGLGGTLGLYACCVGIHFAVADFVTPKILGSRVNINATTSTIALVAWGELWGSVGLILAIPLTSVIKIFFEHSDFFWLKWIAGLMSEDVDAALKPAKVAKEAKAAQKATFEAQT